MLVNHGYHGNACQPGGGGGGGRKGVPPNLLLMAGKKTRHHRKYISSDVGFYILVIHISFSFSLFFFFFSEFVVQATQFVMTLRHLLSDIVSCNPA